MKLFLAIIILSQSVPHKDTIASYDIPPVIVSASLKHNGNFREQPVTASILTKHELENGLIVEPKNLSLTIPNMLQADYGSRMTSSIYLRGLGSRIDQPAVGLYVDNVPILNKNNYDFDYFDLQSIDVLRGPQGTLYGRNTIGGVIDVQTISPFDYQGLRFGIGYGNGNSFNAQAAIYKKPTENFGFSIAANHRYSDGFFQNHYNGSNADKSRSSSLRFKIQALLSNRWVVENSIYANLVKQNGFAYASYNDTSNDIGDINHNDPCTYNRFGLTEGLTFRYHGSRLRFSSTTSYQYTDDDMILDQDFSPLSLFTLQQSQQEHVVTQEFIARSLPEKRWQWISGFFGFYRHLQADAPVNFKRDGIDQLILSNANAHLPSGQDLLIQEEQFPIYSYFKLPAFGLSLYHQSSFRAGNWNFTAGLRADYEHTAIEYSNSTEMHYRFMTNPEYKRLSVALDGKRNKPFFELMPRAAVMYQTSVGNLYVSVTRGYKTGGYNTQIFSDILQNMMMNALMSFDGVGQPYTDDEIDNAISYEPERSWNYELGGHFGKKGGQLQIDAALFYIDCRNQQLTVFPPGNGIGRLMSNAGHTRSFGAELSANYSIKNFRLIGSYGYTNAKFLKYNDGREDYSGNYVPYAPQNTLSIQGEYKLNFRDSIAGHILFVLGGQGAGRIYWNENNSLSQPFYFLVNASVVWRMKYCTVSIWARNLIGSDYNTFYFKSVGRSFVQRGKPLQAGITLLLTL